MINGEIAGVFLGLQCGNDERDEERGLSLRRLGRRVLYLSFKAAILNIDQKDRENICPGIGGAINTVGLGGTPREAEEQSSEEKSSSFCDRFSLKIHRLRFFLAQLERTP